MTEIHPAELQDIPGVGPALSKSVVARFGTWSDLASADPESLGSMRGMRKSALEGIQSLASARQRLLDVETATEFHADAPTEDVVDPLLEVNEDTGEEVQYVLQEKAFGKIDPNTVLRRRVKLTPAVCDICGWDAIEAFGLKPYDELPPEEQARVRLDVAKHKELIHGQKRIISGSEYKEQRKGKKFGVVTH